MHQLANFVMKAESTLTVNADVHNDDDEDMDSMPITMKKVKISKKALPNESRQLPSLQVLF